MPMDPIGEIDADLQAAIEAARAGNSPEQGAGGDGESPSPASQQQAAPQEGQPQQPQQGQQPQQPQQGGQPDPQQAQQPQQSDPHAVAEQARRYLEQYNAQYGQTQGMQPPQGQQPAPQPQQPQQQYHTGPPPMQQAQAPQHVQAGMQGQQVEPPRPMTMRERLKALEGNPELAQSDDYDEQLVMKAGLLAEQAIEQRLAQERQQMMQQFAPIMQQAQQSQAQQMSAQVSQDLAQRVGAPGAQREIAEAIAQLGPQALEAYAQGDPMAQQILEDRAFRIAQQSGANLKASSEPPPQMEPNSAPGGQGTGATGREGEWLDRWQSQALGPLEQELKNRGNY